MYDKKKWLEEQKKKFEGAIASNKAIFDATLDSHIEGADYRDESRMKYRTTALVPINSLDAELEAADNKGHRKYECEFSTDDSTGWGYVIKREKYEQTKEEKEAEAAERESEVTKARPHIGNKVKTGYFLVTEVMYEHGDVQWREWKPFDDKIYYSFVEIEDVVRAHFKETGIELFVKSGTLREDGVFDPDGPVKRVRYIDKDMTEYWSESCTEISKDGSTLRHGFWNILTNEVKYTYEPNKWKREDIEWNLCPECHHHLVHMRRYKSNPCYGDNDWNPVQEQMFTGCSNYPNCHYIEKSKHHYHADGGWGDGIEFDEAGNMWMDAGEFF